MSNRGVWVAGNWKMNHGVSELETFMKGVSSLKGKLPQCLLFPPYLLLDRAVKMSKELSFPLQIGAQNAHFEKKGAFTGEISAPMLQEAGVNWVLVGHSERRHVFGESNELIRKKTESLLEQGMRVVLCVGETKVERERELTLDVLQKQITEAIPTGGKAASYLDGRLLIAYEPVWAIGTGLTATPDQAEEAHALLRGFLKVRLGVEASEATPILYGGSVTPENAKALLSGANVDGLLVGGASLKADSYCQLIAHAASVN